MGDVDETLDFKYNNPAFTDNISGVWINLERFSLCEWKLKDATVDKFSFKGCEKGMHKICYTCICMRYILHQLPEFEVSCTKTYQTTSVKELDQMEKDKDGSLSLLWYRDGKGGPDSDENLITVILEWWRTYGNWERYPDKQNQGTNRIQMCDTFSKEISKVSSFTRKANLVKLKIQAMEQCWSRAHDWENNTDQGVKEDEGIESFEAGVRGGYKFYLTMYDIIVYRCYFLTSVTLATL